MGVVGGHRGWYTMASMTPTQCTCTTANIDKILGSRSHSVDRYIPGYTELAVVVNELKSRNLRIVLTQGVFDLLHEGHARYLERAVSYGDVLVVGVDTDEFTRARKGPNRPIVPFEERLHMLSHLRHVSLLTRRDVNMEIGDLIRTVRPHVLVTSESTKDFPPDAVAEYREYCKDIVMLPPQGATSTTARIRRLSIDGAGQLAQELAERIPKVVQESLEKLSGM